MYSVNHKKGKINENHSPTVTQTGVNPNIDDKISSVHHWVYILECP